jgi:hypothetical protein
MSTRTVHVWHLIVMYPEGSDVPGWQPACWAAEAAPDARDLLTSRRARRYRRWQQSRVFAWPRERMFLSSSSAYERAALLRRYGAEVAIERSLAVEWPETVFTDDTETFCPSLEPWIAYDASGIPLDLAATIFVVDLKGGREAGAWGHLNQPVTWAVVATGPGKTSPDGRR